LGRRRQDQEIFHHLKKELYIPRLDAREAKFTKMIKAWH
jgi:hypothetical protein